MEMKSNVLYYAAASATAIAGIFHLIMAPGMFNFNANAGILFSIGGAAQVFWAVPMARKWGRKLYATGAGGTLVLAMIWVITRMPGNPITGRGGGVNEMAVAVETMQALFIGLAMALIVLESRTRKVQGTVEAER